MFKQCCWWLGLVVTQGCAIGCTNVLFHTAVHEVYHVAIEGFVYEQESKLAFYFWRCTLVLVSALITGMITTHFVPECSGGGGGDGGQGMFADEF